MKRLFLATAALCLFAGAAFASQSFKGTWEVTKREPAPWLDVHISMEPHYAKELDKAKLVFADDKLSAPLGWMACENPKYEVYVVPFKGLFEGGLDIKDRGYNYTADTARKLGFTKEPVLSLTSSCGELIYHFADNDTMLFALDNVIYTLKRVK